MGGCGGKKAREKRKAAVATGPGGKFDSTGAKAEQQANLALIVRLLGEIGPDGEALLPLHNDRLFLQDTRIKLNTACGAATFGWRQVEAMVRVHGQVVVARRKEAADARNKVS